jgi:gamma-resorcylate decarboxylase
MLHYFTNNFVLTTSGHFNTPALRNAVDIIGADRVLLSVDYPYETTAAACDWFDSLGESDGFTAEVIDGLAFGNAKRIFGL